MSIPVISKTIAIKQVHTDRLTGVETTNEVAILDQNYNMLDISSHVDFEKVNTIKTKIRAATNGENIPDAVAAFILMTEDLLGAIAPGLVSLSEHIGDDISPEQDSNLRKATAHVGEMLQYFRLTMENYARHQAGTYEYDDKATKETIGTLQALHQSDQSTKH